MVNKVLKFVNTGSVEHWDSTSFSIYERYAMHCFK